MKKVKRRCMYLLLIIACLVFYSGSAMASPDGETSHAQGASINAQSTSSTITYTYDALDRLIKVQYGDGTTINYTYDAAGNILSVSSSSSSYGDVNKDSKVDGFDALDILLHEAQLFGQMSTGAENLIQTIPQIADVNNDSAVNGFDALDILLHEAQLFEQMSAAAKGNLGD